MKLESSKINFIYCGFTSEVRWDNIKCIWFIGWIIDESKETLRDILNEPPYILTGKYIQELQAKFEDYIDNYLRKKERKINNQTMYYMLEDECNSGSIGTNIFVVFLIFLLIYTILYITKN